MVRIGILGAARIAPAALVKPAATRSDVEVVGVAARDTAKASAFAAKHGLATVFDSYDALVDDPSVDAVYNPLPNGLHGRWTLRALEAGKHVLCEKPFTANADEARSVATAAAARPDLVVMEAFHWRYHPLARNIVEVVESGAIGTLRRIDTSMCIPLPKRNDIRYQWSLAGGSLMDVGCYALHMNRTFAGGVPVVRSARAKSMRSDARIDRWITAELEYGEVRGSIRAALWSGDVLRIGARIVGTDGEIRVLNPTQPGIYHRAVLRNTDGRRNVGVSDKRASYWHQLDAFVAAVGGDHDRNLTDTNEAVITMDLIDAVYRAAGLPVREPT